MQGIDATIEKGATPGNADPFPERRSYAYTQYSTSWVK